MSRHPPLIHVDEREDESECRWYASEVLIPYTFPSFNSFDIRGDTICASNAGNAIRWNGVDFKDTTMYCSSFHLWCSATHVIVEEGTWRPIGDGIISPIFIVVDFPNSILFAKPPGLIARTNDSAERWLQVNILVRQSLLDITPEHSFISPILALSDNWSPLLITRFVPFFFWAIRRGTRGVYFFKRNVDSDNTDVVLVCCLSLF